MLPPDFVRHLEAKGLYPPYCRDCVHVADLDRSEVCLKYGAYVLLYSSCGSFERRVGSDSPVVKAEEVVGRFSSGLNDLR